MTEVPWLGRTRAWRNAPCDDVLPSPGPGGGMKPSNQLPKQETTAGPH